MVVELALWDSLRNGGCRLSSAGGMTANVFHFLRTGTSCPTTKPSHKGEQRQRQLRSTPTQGTAGRCPAMGVVVSISPRLLRVLYLEPRGSAVTTLGELSAVLAQTAY